MSAGEAPGQRSLLAPLSLPRGPASSCAAWGWAPGVASARQRVAQGSPGPGVAVRMLQQQALVAGQHVGVVVLHQAAHAHKQDLALQVELRVLLKDAVVPHFASGLIPHDQNLPRLGGGVPDAVETVLGRPPGARGLEEPLHLAGLGGVDEH